MKLEQVLKEASGYYKLLDKAHKDELVVELKSGHYIAKMKDDEVLLTRTTLVPYLLLDTEEYDLLEELTKDVFEDLIKKG